MSFMGLDGFFWFTGVVEDRNDPKKLGRVKVRCVGIHTESLARDDNTGRGLPVSNLPWAQPLLPVTSPCIGGIGETSRLIEGTWVFGFARDGRTYNDLVIVGTYSGQSDSGPTGLGFSDTLDPAGRPKRPDEAADEKYPKAAYLKEPDVNRLARNESPAQIDKTIVKKKKDSEDKKVPIANTSATWDELTNPYNANYPFNNVVETESGHITEYDDTPQHERVHNYHRSGTFDEIHPDGSKVLKIVGDDYEIFMKNKNVHIQGDVNITVDGNANLYIKKNVEMQVDGNVHEVIKGNLTREITGNKTESVGGFVSHTASGTYEVTSGGNNTTKAPAIHHN